MKNIKKQKEEEEREGLLTEQDVVANIPAEHLDCSSHCNMLHDTQ